MSRQGTLYEIRLSFTTAIIISTTSHYVGCNYYVPAGKTVTHICTVFTGATGTPVVNARLETISAKFPSNTLVATGAESTNILPTVGPWFECALTTPYTVGAVDEYLSVVIRLVSGTSCSTRLYGGPIIETPCAVSNTGTASKRTGIPYIVLKFSDGTYSNHAAPVKDVDATVYTSTSTPDEKGTKFTLRRNAYIYGIATQTRAQAGATGQLRLYDAGLNVLSTDAECVLTDGEDFSNNSNYGLIYKQFSNPILCKPGIYYVTKTATHSTNGIYSNVHEFPNQTAMDVVAPDCSLVTRSDYTGAFTETALKYELVAPLIDGTFSNQVSIG